MIAGRVLEPVEVAVDLITADDEAVGEPDRYGVDVLDAQRARGVGAIVEEEDLGGVLDDTVVVEINQPPERIGPAVGEEQFELCRGGRGDGCDGPARREHGESNSFHVSPFLRVRSGHLRRA